MKQASGQLRSDLPPYVIVRALLSDVLGYVMFNRFLPGTLQRKDHEAEIEMVVEVLLNGIASKSD
mgnify:CR=1 FL=1